MHHHYRNCRPEQRRNFTEFAAIYIPDIVVSEGGPLLKRRMRCRMLECHHRKLLHTHKNRPVCCSFCNVPGRNSGLNNRSDVTPLHVMTFNRNDDGPASFVQKCDSGC